MTVTDTLKKYSNVSCKLLTFFFFEVIEPEKKPNKRIQQYFFSKQKFDLLITEKQTPFPMNFANFFFELFLYPNSRSCYIKLFKQLERRERLQTSKKKTPIFIRFFLPRS